MVPKGLVLVLLCQPRPVIRRPHDGVVPMADRPRGTRQSNQQYLNPQVEKVLTQGALRMARNGHARRVKQLPNLAQLIDRQRCSICPISANDHEIRTPSKNWAQWFLRRNPELSAKRLKAIDLKRHGPNIYEKTADWFTIIGKELQSTDIVPDNVYNMDETDCRLSAPVFGECAGLQG